MPTLTSRHTAAAVGARDRRAAAGALLTVFGLAECSANVPPPPPPTTAASSDGDHTDPDSSTQPTLSDDEALRIGVTTYEKFIEADRYVIESGASKESVDTFRDLITNDMNTYLDKTIKLAESDHFIIQGDMQIASSRIRYISSDELIFFACLDLADSQMIDSKGVATETNRRNKIQLMQITIKNIQKNPRVKDVRQWQDSSSCI